MKSYDNLMYLKVLDSGHMVPLDLPEESFDMMQSFLFGKSFNSYEQTIPQISKQMDCPSCPTTTKGCYCPTCPSCQSTSSSAYDGNYDHHWNQGRYDPLPTLSMGDLTSGMLRIFAAIAFVLSIYTWLLARFATRNSEG